LPFRPRRGSPLIDRASVDGRHGPRYQRACRRDRQSGGCPSGVQPHGGRVGLALDPEAEREPVTSGVVEVENDVIAASPILVGQRSQTTTAARWLSALVDGVADAWRPARHPTWRLAGAVGYLGFDMALLLCMLRGLGYDANCGTLILGYLIGYLATIIPIPAGIGVLEGGLVGTLVFYGAPPAQTAAAVLIYHAIAFRTPSLGGLGAYTALLSHSRTHKINHHGRHHPPAQFVRARRKHRQINPTCDRIPTLRPGADKSPQPSPGTAVNHHPKRARIQHNTP
jgi:Lysylphosphatidylglycerol synthase TM region